MKTKQSVHSFRIFLMSLCLMLPLFMASVCYADEPPILEGDSDELPIGVVNVGIYGSYCGEADEALQYINEIRLEACQEGVPNPNNPSVPLTMADYVPLKWSTDLESIARIRACEARFIIGHARHNGQSIFTISYNGLTSEAENLAWNWDTSMVPGIEQFYDEKSDWLLEASGKPFPNDGEVHQTGHYKALINPSYRYVGVAHFTSDGLYGAALAQEFSSKSKALSEDELPIYSKVYQTMEVKASMLDDYSVEIPAEAAVGDSFTPVVKAVFTVGRDTFTVRSLEEYTYSFGTAGILSIDASGRINAIAAGSTTLTVKMGNTVIGSATVTVKGGHQLSEATITLSEDRLRYDGTPKTPRVIVEFGGVYLKEGTQYTVTYSNNVQVGTAKVTITGIGNVSGTVTKDFVVFCKHVGDFTKVSGEPLLEGYCTICHNQTVIELPTDVSVYWRNKETAQDGGYWSTPAYFTHPVGSTLSIWINQIIGGDRRYGDLILDCSDWSKLSGPKELPETDIYDYEILGSGTVTITISSKYNPDLKKTWSITFVEGGEQPEPTSVSNAYSIQLGAELSGDLFFRVAVTVDETKYANCSNVDPYLLIKVGDEVRLKGYLKDAETEYLEGRLAYVFHLKFNAKEMGDKVEFRFYVNDSVSDTRIMSTTFNSYLDNLMVDYQNKQEIYNVAKALRNYGSYARKFFRYHDSTLDDTDYIGTLTGRDTVADAIRETLAVSGSSEHTTFYGMTLVLEDRLVERFYFKSDIDLCKLNTSVCFSGEAGLYYIPVTQIDFDSILQAWTVSVDGITVSASPLDYVRMVMRNSADTNLVDICRAIYDCHLAIKAFR